MSAFRDIAQASPLHVQSTNSVDPASLPRNLSGVFIESRLQELVHQLIGQDSDVGPILVSMAVDVNNSRPVTWNDVKSLPPILTNWPAISNALRRVSMGGGANLDIVTGPAVFMAEDKDALNRSEFLSKTFGHHWRNATNQLIEVNGKTIAVPRPVSTDRFVDGFLLDVNSGRCGLHFYSASGEQDGSESLPSQATQAFWMTEPLVGYLIGALTEARKAM